MGKGAEQRQEKHRKRGVLKMHDARNFGSIRENKMSDWERESLVKIPGW